MANKRVNIAAAVNQLQTGQWPCLDDLQKCGIAVTNSVFRECVIHQTISHTVDTRHLTHVSWQTSVDACQLLTRTSTNTNSMQSAITTQRMASKQADLKPRNNCGAVPQCKRRLRLHCFFQQLMSAHTRTDSCSNTDTHTQTHSNNSSHSVTEHMLRQSGMLTMLVKTIVNTNTFVTILVNVYYIQQSSFFPMIISK